ncbi:MAG: hypothetical protein AAF512_05735 [Pseudomonadota bacterium]
MTYHTRVAYAYLAWGGAPLIWFIITTYSIAGFCLFAGYRQHWSALILVTALLLTGGLLHTDLQGSGPGEMPRSIYLYLQFLQLLLMISIAGGLLRMSTETGSDRSLLNKPISWQAYGIVLTWSFSRVMIASWFIFIGWWPLPSEPLSIPIILVHGIFAVLFIINLWPIATVLGLLGLLLLHININLLWQLPLYPLDWQMHLGLLYISLTVAVLYHLKADSKR